MITDILRHTMLVKAEENLASAASEFANDRYNPVANRAYYACYHAAIVALLEAGIQPTHPRGQWSHAGVQAQFAGQLVTRRKVYPPALRDTLPRLEALREQADYEASFVSRREASQALERAYTFSHHDPERG